MLIKLFLFKTQLPNKYKHFYNYDEDYCCNCP